MYREIKLSDMRSLSEYRKRLIDKPRIKYLFLELTDACNMNCLHCGSCSSSANSQFLPFSGIKKVLDSVSMAYDASKITICLTGGEPLLHKDLFDIIRYAKQRDFRVGITSNATLISEQVACELANAGVESMTVSLDGLKDTHEWFRGVKGSFSRTIRGVMALLKTEKIATQLTTVAHKKNLNELDDIFELACDLGVCSWKLINIEPIGRALEHKELFLEKDEYKYLFDYIKKKRDDDNVKIEVTYGCSHYLGVDQEREVRDWYFLCGSGILVASVLCNGDIYSCLDIQRRKELVQGNIFCDDFVDVWENKFKEFRVDRANACKMCQRCEERERCNADSAHTWDYDKNMPLICFKELI